MISFITHNVEEIWNRRRFVRNMNRYLKSLYQEAAPGTKSGAYDCLLCSRGVHVNGN